MKKIIVYCICSIIILSSCSTPEKKSIERESISPTNSFEVVGTLQSYLSDKVYLNKIIEETLYPIDSSLIKNNQFTFNGIVEYPERFALTFENYSAVIVFILENTKFNMEINPVAIQDPIITGSSLNASLMEYKTISKSIFKKIDYLFPKFQKARLENDAEKLEEIGARMKLIETEFTEFSYRFIEKNDTSFVAAMILRDLLKSSNIDTLRIKKSYQLLSNKVKEGPDAEIIALTLNLH